MEMRLEESETLFTFPCLIPRDLGLDEMEAWLFEIRSERARLADMEVRVVLVLDCRWK